MKAGCSSYCSISTTLDFYIILYVLLGITIKLVFYVNALVVNLCEIEAPEQVSFILSEFI